MRELLCLVSLGCLIGLISSQSINPNSLFCGQIGLSKTSTLAVKNKFKTLLINLAKDKTLLAQQNRAKTWLNTNFKDLGMAKTDLDWRIPNVLTALEARWRIVAYFKGLLAKIKAKVAAAKFTEIQKLMWKTDKDGTNNAMYTYPTFKQQALALLTDPKKTEIQTIITNWESADSKKSPKDFGSDSMTWLSPPGFTGCSIS